MRRLARLLMQGLGGLIQSQGAIAFVIACVVVPGSILLAWQVDPVLRRIAPDPDAPNSLVTPDTPQHRKLDDAASPARRAAAPLRHRSDAPPAPTASAVSVVKPPPSKPAAVALPSPAPVPATISAAKPAEPEESTAKSAARDTAPAAPATRVIPAPKPQVLAANVPLPAARPDLRTDEDEDEEPPRPRRAQHPAALRHAVQRMRAPRHEAVEQVNYSPLTTLAGVGAYALVAEARRYIGTNPTTRASLWCARFMNFVLKRTGYKGTNSDAALSFAHYGHRVAGPRIGAIAVMRRKGGGHVGVVSGIDRNGNPIIISGNNGRMGVGVSVYPRRRIIAYVLPQR